ncbi:MAG: permease [Oscillospiraceae bacterium]|nr:permease [Oscillospiraceae bacterium]
MTLGSIFSVTGIGFMMFCVFIVAALGYALGRITVKGVNLGTAGVFIVALLFGCFFFNPLQAQLMNAGATYVSNALKILENLGLMLFVTAVGFIAGPNFFAGLKKNFKSYILLGAAIIISGALACIFCIVAFDCNASMAVGILSGALTSTPAFSAAKETVQVIAETPEMAIELENMVTVGHGIAYLFGVVGVVLFVQLIPKFTKANMAEERAKLVVASDGSRKEIDHSKLINIDGFGFAAFALAVVVGILLGGIKIPMGNSSFSLGTTGGTLLASLVIAHFGKIGKLSMHVEIGVLKVFRELGLMLFLIGAGIPGGAHFVEYFAPEYFFYGVIMTIVPMIVGYIIASKVLRLPMLNNLGSITGGMTSTPALGTLINVSGTDDVASAYAATYPVALVLVVLVSQFIILLF